MWRPCRRKFQQVCLSELKHHWQQIRALTELLSNFFQFYEWPSLGKLLEREPKHDEILKISLNRLRRRCKRRWKSTSSNVWRKLKHRRRTSGCERTPDSAVSGGQTLNECSEVHNSLKTACCKAKTHRDGGWLAPIHSAGQIKWTADSERALTALAAGSKGALRKLYKKWISYLNKLTAMTRVKLSKIDRNKVVLSCLSIVPKRSHKWVLKAFFSVPKHHKTKCS